MLSKKIMIMASLSIFIFPGSIHAIEKTENTMPERYTSMLNHHVSIQKAMVNENLSEGKIIENYKNKKLLFISVPLGNQSLYCFKSLKKEWLDSLKILEAGLPIIQDIEEKKNLEEAIRSDKKYFNYLSNYQSSYEQAFLSYPSEKNYKEYSHLIKLQKNAKVAFEKVSYGKSLSESSLIIPQSYFKALLEKESYVEEKYAFLKKNYKNRIDISESVRKQDVIFQRSISRIENLSKKKKLSVYWTINLEKAKKMRASGLDLAKQIEADKNHDISAPVFIKYANNRDSFSKSINISF